MITELDTLIMGDLLWLLHGYDFSIVMIFGDLSNLWPPGRWTGNRLIHPGTLSTGGDFVFMLAEAID